MLAVGHTLHRNVKETSKVMLLFAFQHCINRTTRDIPNMICPYFPDIGGVHNQTTCPHPQPSISLVLTPTSSSVAAWMAYNQQGVMELEP